VPSRFVIPIQALFQPTLDAKLIKWKYLYWLYRNCILYKNWIWCQSRL